MTLHKEGVHTVLTCAHHYHPKKEASFHSAATLSAPVPKWLETGAGGWADTVSVLTRVRSDKTRPQLRFRSPGFASALFFDLLVVFVVYTSKNESKATCWRGGMIVDSTPDTYVRASHELWTLLKSVAFPTTEGGVGCRQSSTINCSALFGVLLSVATGVSKCLTPKHQLFFFFYYFFLLAAADISFHALAWLQELPARPHRGGEKKKKVFIWCNGKETTTMCATFCSLERSSATKHFDWTLLCNPALQTVPFFLWKTEHKGITPKIARISGCSIKEDP